MTLDNRSLSFLPYMYLVFLRFIRVFVTSQMAKAPLTTALWTICTFRFLLRSWAFILSCQNIRVLPNFICNITRSWDIYFSPKMLFRLPASSVSSSPWRLFLSSYPCSDSPTPDFLWHSFLWPALALEELILIFCFFFLCPICSLSSPPESDLMTVQSLLSHYQVSCLTFLSLFLLALALERLFSTILLVRFSNLDIRVFAKGWKL